MVFRFRPGKQWGRYNTRLFKEIYAARMKRVAPRLPLPKAVRTLGIRVEDPNHPDFPRKTTPDVVKINHPAWPVPVQEEDHPLYKATACLRFDGTESMAEGWKQALRLSKAVGRQGLPQHLLERANALAIANLDALLYRFIMQARRWDSTLERLPLRRDPVYWWFKFPRYHGIPVVRQNAVLLGNMFRFCHGFGKEYPHLKEHRYIRDFRLNVVFEHGSDIMNFTLSPHMIVRAPEPLKAVCSPQQVAETETENIPDIYPIDARIDLVKDHVYNEETVLPPVLPSSPLSIHTVLVNKEKDFYHLWTPSEITGNAILCSFTAAMAVARQKYGNVKGVLPHPLVTQCIQCCDNVLDFVIFQLNTTDFGSDGGVKNVVYFDGDNRFFDVPEYWKNMTEVKNLRADVFRKFLALMLH